MLRVLTVASIVLFTVICCSNSRSRKLNAANLSERRPEAQQNASDRRFNIKSTQGVVVINKFAKGDFVQIYNADGSFWHRFSYYYDDRDGKFDYANEEFKPFAFHADHFLLALKCTKRDDNSLEVIVNEDTRLRKYVKANDPVLKLEPWDKFVLGVFAVTFDQETNPMLEGPDEQTKRMLAPKGATFRPVEMRGNWLKISWQSSEEQPTKTATGWIRWRNDETLLIDLFFFA